MTIVGIFESKNRLSEFVDRAARGEQLARLLPAQPPDALDQALALANRIRRSRTGQPSGDGRLMRDIIKEGRR